MLHGRIAYPKEEDENQQQDKSEKTDNKNETALKSESDNIDEIGEKDIEQSSEETEDAGQPADKTPHNGTVHKNGKQNKSRKVKDKEDESKAKSS